jgi:hypothetical protein
MPPVEQELLTLPEHLRSPPVLVGSVLLELLFVTYLCKNTGQYYNFFLNVDLLKDNAKKVVNFYK